MQQDSPICIQGERCTFSRQADCRLRRQRRPPLPLFCARQPHRHAPKPLVRPGFPSCRHLVRFLLKLENDGFVHSREGMPAEGEIGTHRCIQRRLCWRSAERGSDVRRMTKPTAFPTLFLTIAKEQRQHEHEVEARIHLARLIQANSESAVEDPNQEGFRRHARRVPHVVV